MTKSSSPLPKTYLKWLRKLGDEPEVDFDDREWRLADADGLWESVVIDGNETPFLQQSSSYVATIEDVTGEEATEDEDGNEIPFARIAKWLTIGDDNEDLLCVDPADEFAVWCFYPTGGGDVERLADSLDDFMDGAEPIV